MQSNDVLRYSIHRLTGRFMTVFIAITVLLLAAVTLLASLLYSYESVTLQGTIEPSASTIVRPQCDGIVTGVYVQDGDSVVAGQVLLDLDKEDVKARVAASALDLAIGEDNLARSLEELRLLQATNDNRLSEARLTVERLRAEVSDQTRLWETSKDIHSRVSLTDSIGAPMEPVELRDKKISLAQAELALDFAQKRKTEETIKSLEIETTRKSIAKTEQALALARDQLTRTTLCASQSGRILGCDAKTLAGAHVAEGQALFRIGDLSGWIARTYAPETDLPKLKNGLDAMLFVKAYPYEKYRTFRGRVIQVNTSPITAGAGGDGSGGNSGFYPVTVAITDESMSREGGDIRFRDGLTAEVKIVTRKDRLLLLVVDRLFSTAGKLKSAPIESGN